jgi:hypothetical protein
MSHHENYGTRSTSYLPSEHAIDPEIQRDQMQAQKEHDAALLRILRSPSETRVLKRLLELREAHSEQEVCS